MNEYEVIERGGDEYPNAMAVLETHPLSLAWLRELVRRVYRRLLEEGRLVEVGGRVEAGAEVQAEGEMEVEVEVTA